MTARGRPRLVDVAAHLGVAPSTVSRALADSPAVSPATRERVVAAARELGYSVNPAASGLKRGRTLNIGFIAVMSYWYAGALATGADRVAAGDGYDFVVVNAVDGRRDQFLERARRLGRRVDGVLVNDVREGALLDDLIDAVDVPVVTVGCRAEGVSSVEVDNHRIGARAASHLRELGHRSAVVLSLTNPSPLGFDNAAVRAQGFDDDFDGDVFTPAPLPIAAAERQRCLFDATANATAVFCTADALAIETVALLRQVERHVPHEVSVVGVDDHPLSEPIGLTTVAQSPEHMGALATRQLIDELEGDAVSTHHVVETALVARATSGRASTATLTS